MLYRDSVDSEALVHKPLFIGSIFMAVLAASMMCDFSGTLIGQLLRPVIGDPLQSGVYGRFAISLVLSLLFCLNIVLIGFAPLKVQIGVVWLELLLLFLGFFSVFHLSVPFIVKNLPYLITQGAFTTLYVSAISLLFASFIGLVAAVAKLSTNGFAYGVASFYTSFFRGVPQLMQIYIIYLGLPQLGVSLDTVPSGVLAISLCSGAYMGEIFRAGIQSIDRGQWEASRSLGFGFGLTMRRIILPQSFPIIIPPMGNMFIGMLKDSSLVSVLGVWELTFLARSIGVPTFQTMEMLIAASMIYWVMSACLEMVQARIEQYFARSKAR
ncbi:amino acid ABC transporter permease [Mesorhizobium sp. WSM3866]|uniref:amino acid ABC transporter permease n=1 Tax=Mesorhizobium sp. WSM3866 TaxID=422271 RepID=UPI000BAF7F60|nr:amino acid ABC transporter permease [Mesorhizobium sp. WSM3866]PBB41199.1 amino acid ABC transporter permease [Mesorhizobium sp. WSM3866]